MAAKPFLPLIALCAAVSPFAAAANTAACADRTTVTQALMERFGEEHSGSATSGSDEVLEIYHNASSQTWTILLTLPDRDLSCLVASGTGEGPLATQLASLDN